MSRVTALESNLIIVSLLFLNINQAIKTWVNTLYLFIGLFIYNCHLLFYFVCFIFHFVVVVFCPFVTLLFFQLF